MSSVLRFDEWQDSNGNPVLDGTGLVIPSSSLPTGSILQVVSTTKTDTFSTTSTAYVDVTGFNATITPLATSSKILIVVSFNIKNSGNTIAAARLLRDATVIGGGAPVGSRSSAIVGHYVNGMTTGSAANHFLDSPNSVSPITYKIQMLTNGGTAFVGFTANDADGITEPRISSTITVMEVAG